MATFQCNRDIVCYWHKHQLVTNNRSVTVHQHYTDGTGLVNTQAFKYRSLQIHSHTRQNQGNVDVAFVEAVLRNINQIRDKQMTVWHVIVHVNRCYNTCDTRWPRVQYISGSDPPSSCTRHTTISWHHCPLARTSATGLVGTVGDESRCDRRRGDSQTDTLSGALSPVTETNQTWFTNWYVVWSSLSSNWNKPDMTHKLIRCL